MIDETLQAEVERLRTEVESYKQRELAELRSALAAAQEAAAHYRGEAERNANIGRELDATHRDTISTLRSELETARRLNVRRIP